jgi:hypothetical protein
MKLVLTDLASLTNYTSAIATINANSDRVETAIENTLSRNGASPNEMEASLDMNSNRILNLPAPGSAGEPVRQQDIDALITAIVNASNTGTNYVSKLGDTMTGVLTFNVTPSTAALITVPGFVVAKNGGIQSITTGTPDDSVRLLSIATITGTSNTFDLTPNKFYTVSNTDMSGAAAGSAVSGLVVNHGSNGGSGAKHGAWIVYNHLASTPTPVGRDFYTGCFVTVEATTTDGGTVPSPKGNFFGIGSIVTARAAATGLTALIGAEFDVANDAGASYAERVGMQIVVVNGSTTKGTALDAAMLICNDGTITAPGKFGNGILFGRAGTKFPVDGTLIGTVTTVDAMAVVNAIDFSAITCSGSLLKGPGGLNITGTGRIEALGIASRAGTGGAPQAQNVNIFWNTGTSKVEVWVDSTLRWTQP